MKITAMDLLAQDAGCDSLVALPRDLSSRLYYRGKKSAKSVILMCYPDASSANIQELRQFIKIAKFLDSQGLKTPEILKVNETYSYALLEDMGDTTFDKAINNGNNVDDLYTLATDVLKRLRQIKPPSFLPEFQKSRIHINVRQMVDYYIPYASRRYISDTLKKEFIDVWNEIEEGLPICEQGFLHSDFHLENLMYIESQTGLKRAGVIDFQDALQGPIAYDLVNLLEDARNDVPVQRVQRLLSRYCEGMNNQQEISFRAWYRVLGTQFHCRVLGLFIKASVELGKDKYLNHINRLQFYLKKEIEDPLLLPLKKWFLKIGLEFTPIKDLQGDTVRNIFRDTQFLIPKGKE